MISPREWHIVDWEPAQPARQGAVTGWHLWVSGGASGLGRDDDRPTPGKFTALALPNIDRGMRDPRDLEDLIDLVEQYGMHVVGMTGSIDLTTGEGISSARREVDQRNRESRNISRRMAAGNRRAALAGRHHGGANRPFGWRKDEARSTSGRRIIFCGRSRGCWHPTLLRTVHPQEVTVRARYRHQAGA
jgi:DNA invertase Pin-like site-specific DNA recombinase